MNGWRLVHREIIYRKLEFGLGVLAVSVAVGCLVAVMTLLRGHDLRVTELTNEQEEATLALMHKVQDDYRVIMKKLGYNLLIVHKDQDLTEFLTQGYASRLMPEEFAERLAASNIVTIRHLLPTLHQKIRWPEYENRPLVLIGVRGEVSPGFGDPKEPMMDPVQPGNMRIGYILHEQLGLDVDDTATLLGRQFTVTEVHAPRGNTDDITIWIHLDEAQKMLEKPGKINAIMALNCLCGDGGNIESIRKNVAAILPETQVIQLTARALVRNEARTRASTLNTETAQSDDEYHARLRREREAFAAWTIPLVIIGCIMWVGLLSFSNVRQRTTEIGILRALGYRSKQIMAIFLSKAVLMGLAGAVVGYVAGFFVGIAWGRLEDVPVSVRSAVSLFNPGLLASILMTAPILAAVASWIPAVVAVQQDPAVVLRED